MKKNKLTQRITSFVCFDIETTGLNPSTNQIIEIGAVKVKDGKVSGRFSELINPGIPLPDLIVRLTGINDAMLKNADTVSNVLRRFLEFAEEEVVIGHNIMFDYSFIKSAAVKEKLTFEKQGIDTLELSRKLHPELESRSLENMCKFYHINNVNAHRAYDDAHATTLLYVNLCNIFFEENINAFRPKPLIFKVKKVIPITKPQKNYLNDLLKYHKIESMCSLDTLTQSEASRWIDKIILEKGRIN